MKALKTLLQRSEKSFQALAVKGKAQKALEF